MPAKLAVLTFPPSVLRYRTMVWPKRLTRQDRARRADHRLVDKVKGGEGNEQLVHCRPCRRAGVFADVNECLRRRARPLHRSPGLGTQQLRRTERPAADPRGGGVGKWVWV